MVGWRQLLDAQATREDKLTYINARPDKQANFCGGLAALGNQHSNLVSGPAPEHVSGAGVELDGRLLG